MKKLGLALSGGGFRASLYHLGLIRFLRDAGLLSQVTHITSVSGGSIIAAHLALHWQRYTGSEADFDAVAEELLAFIRLDIRNRILRRFPLAVPVGRVRRLMGKSSRQLTRSGLLEYHYEKHLYGDVSLFELPKSPRLHLLTTNLSEGCLCSFHRDGLLMARRHKDDGFRLDAIHTGLATVPMAVAASSAFPGFFPPLELTGAEVGVSGGEFGRQAYTDGGVYDNLGIRMFRFLERQILLDDPLSKDDFLDIRAAFEALRAASISPEKIALSRLAEVLGEAERSSEDTPLHRLAMALEEAMAPTGGATTGSRLDEVLSRLGEVMRHYQFQHEPLFAYLKPPDPAASDFLKTSRIGVHSLDAGDQFWLNRHLLDAAFREATGHPCLKRLNSGLDGVIVSDVGRQIKVVKGHGGGLIRSALRSTDILMNRVWQLENETFQSSSEFVFARVTDLIEPTEDPTALHPEIQRHLAGIRTDLDQFSPLEISSLVRHGYCMGRKVCRSRPDMFGKDLPSGPPWDPLHPRDTTGGTTSESSPSSPSSTSSSHRQPTAVTTEARELQLSENRRIWSRLFDPRDWISYVYVPIIVPILFLVPYITMHYYERYVRLNHLTLSYAQGSPDLTQLDHMLDSEPAKPWKGVTVEEGHVTAPPDLSGFRVLRDSRISDLRAWNPAVVGTSDPNSSSRAYTYRRVSVVKTAELKGPALFPVRLILAGPDGEVRFPSSQALQGKVVKTLLDDGKTYRWDAVFDLTKEPAEIPVDLVVECLAPGMFLHGTESATGMAFNIEADTSELAQWVLMPKGYRYKDYHYVYYKRDHPETAIQGKFFTQYLADDSTVLAFKLLSLDPGHDHEILWNYVKD